MNEMLISPSIWTMQIDNLVNDKQLKYGTWPKFFDTVNLFLLI
jgi:hypothetical protein